MPPEIPSSINIYIAAATGKAAAADRVVVAPRCRKAAEEVVAAVPGPVARTAVPVDMAVVARRIVAAQAESAAIRRRHKVMETSGASMPIAALTDAAAGSAAVRNLQSCSCRRRTSSDAAEAGAAGIAMVAAAGTASIEADWEAEAGCR